MADLYHYYGGDLSVSPAGDIMMASQLITGTQRIYRRLLTNPQLNDVKGNPVASGDYTAHPTYGSGLPRKVGQPQNIASTSALIKGQMMLEPCVSNKPLPSVKLTPTQQGVSAYITYTDDNTAALQLIEFNINQ